MPFSSDRERGAHLLRRFGLGASEAELDYYLSGGLQGAIAKLTNPPADPGATIDVELLRNEKGFVPMPQIVNTWVLRLLATRRPLEERMTVFWHNHFATSASKVQGGMLMYAQNQTLRDNALGTFPALLSAVSKDPAMLFWLDNEQNVKGKPNENFAREVMELFTLGIGHYSEKDVQEGARAFTGWSLQKGGGKKKAANAGFLYRPRLHDDGMKTFLGQTGPFQGDDILKILCDQPQCATFLTRKIWDWFVWPNPDDATIAPFAARFKKNGLDIKTLLEDIMGSEEFYSERAQRSIVKSPVDVVVVTMRQLGMGEAARQMIGETTGKRGAVGPAYAAQQAMKAMGQFLMYPPDVSGWKNGNTWITSATMSERIAWGERIFGQNKSGRIALNYPAFGLIGDAKSPDDVVHKLASVFDVSFSPERRKILVKAAELASGGSVTPQNASKVAGSVAHLMFATPEFQFC